MGFNCRTCNQKMAAYYPSAYCSDICWYIYNNYTVKGEYIGNIKTYHVEQFGYDPDEIYTLKGIHKIGGLNHAFLENI